MTREHLQAIIKEMEEELQYIQNLKSQGHKTPLAYALSGRFLTFRRIIRPLKGIDDLYAKLEELTAAATSLI
jgi:hypothetical protein